ncbi:hypothetical protein D3C80_1387050 [compost metagenome]
MRNQRVLRSIILHAQGFGHHLGRAHGLRGLTQGCLSCIDNHIGFVVRISYIGTIDGKDALYTVPIQHTRRLVGDDVGTYGARRLELGVQQ